MTSTTSPPQHKSYPTDLTDTQWKLLQPLLLLPNDFPPEGTVRRYFHYFKRTRQFEHINNALRAQVREQEGRVAEALGDGAFDFVDDELAKFMSAIRQ